jgi:phosphoribosylamine-glycine ligase
MQYLKQPDGSIISFAPAFVTNDKGEKIQVTAASGEPATKAAYDKQEAKREKEKVVAQAEAMKPKEVTMRQARLALLQAGLLDKVTAAIAGMPSPQKQAAEIEWEYSNSLKRSQPLVVQLGAALGLDAAALDLLFSTASKL